MPDLTAFLNELDTLAVAAQTAFNEAADAEAVEKARVEFLGAKNGRLKSVQKMLGQVDAAGKPQAGKRFNEVKQQVEAALETAQQRAKQKPTAAPPKKAAKGEGPDSVPGTFDPTESP